MQKKIFNAFFFITMWCAILFVWTCTAIVSIIGIKRIIRKRAGKHTKPTVAFMECLSKGNAGYVYRTTRWVELLNSRGIKAKDFSTLTREVHHVNMLKPYIHFLFFTGNMFKRIVQCFQVLQYDIVIVRRELLLFNDYGDIFLERFLAAAHPYVIFDFDDNINSVKDKGRPLSLYGKMLLERPDKFLRILGLFSYFQPGNHILEELVETEHGNNHFTSMVLPTLVDYTNYQPRTYATLPEKLTIGWIGGAYNLHYLEDIVPALNTLSKKYPLRLLVICSVPFTDDHIDFENVFMPWAHDKELEHIALMDIGIMPLRDSARERGKCGFKLIQYMGHGVPGVGSNVGVNAQIIDDGINGFLVNNPNDWEKVFEHILTHKEMLPIWSKAAYKKIDEAYSYKVYLDKYIDFLTGITHDPQQTRVR